jgi:GntR family transcriptional regulator, rspAB operon transcriptional repressor
MASANVYEILLERILMGRYAPGTPLVEQELSKELGVSRTPVREALLRLRLENLVRVIPRGGTFVAESSVQTIRDVTELRLVLEELLIRLVLERSRDEAIEAFVEWVDRIQAGWHDLPPREWLRLDGQFHTRLYEMAGNRALAHHLSLLRRQAVLFWGQLGEEHNSLIAIHRDFKEVADGLAANDAERCIAAIRRHVLADIERIAAFLKPEPPRMTSYPLGDRTSTEGTQGP